MTKRFQKQIINFISIAVLMVVVFSCQIGIWDVVFPMSSVHGHMMDSSVDCCGNSSQPTGTLDQGVDGGIFTLPNNKLLLIIIFSLILSSLSIFVLSSINLVFNFYFKFIRTKYGGFRQFYCLAYLFSHGIIHPKIY